MKTSFSSVVTPSPPNNVAKRFLDVFYFQHWKWRKGKLPFTEGREDYLHLGKKVGNFQVSQRLLSMIVASATDSPIFWRKRQRNRKIRRRAFHNLTTTALCLTGVLTNDTNCHRSSDTFPSSVLKNIPPEKKITASTVDRYTEHRRFPREGRWVAICELCCPFCSDCWLKVLFKWIWMVTEWWGLVLRPSARNSC